MKLQHIQCKISGPVQIGDVKYANINNDHHINENDMLPIGNEYPTFSIWAEH